MLDSETIGELKRFLCEPSTYTGRAAGSLLVVGERSALDALDLRGDFGIRGDRVTIEHGTLAEAESFARALRRAVSGEESIVIEFLADPHPAMLRWIQRISENGAVRLPCTDGEDQWVTMPEGCHVVGLVEAWLFDEAVVRRDLCRVFELLERI